MALPPLDPADVAGRHLLVLPADVAPEEVEILAVSRFPRATWEVEPSTARPRGGGARGLRTGHAPPGRLRLSQHSVLVGPQVVEPPVGATLGLPPSAGLAYVVE